MQWKYKQDWNGVPQKKRYTLWYLLLLLKSEQVKQIASHFCVIKFQIFQPKLSEPVDNTYSFFLFWLAG